ncbi:hypothetical protein LTR36_010963 [Oleoguttula mirabilis]|uniref:Uncharacterized protein n=1 Tax=Oleoguttula mirabilis TaxID=1507867 RepID=A0AAV9J3W0_9PEZI|nr:hypothetical protein LTR36_010963 [Oleoguttula mirabilis]
MADYPPRPPTPQALIHRLPDRHDVSSTESKKPSKFIVLIVASNAVAGKVQIAKAVSNALACPLFQGDSLHETAAKAASVGAPTRFTGADGDERAPLSGANEARYQRMWLSKMTRTGLLFPDESRPAGGEFSGFGGASSTSTSRRGSASSAASDVSSDDAAGSTSSFTSSVMSVAAPKYINKPPVAIQSEEERLRSANLALLVVTHPKLESWHKRCIRTAVGDYDIGVIFVPLDEDEELPVLRPLDPRTMTSFGSLGTSGMARRGGRSSWDEEVVLRVDVEAKVDDLAEAIVDGLRDIMDV